MQWMVQLIDPETKECGELNGELALWEVPKIYGQMFNFKSLDGLFAKNAERMLRENSYRMGDNYDGNPDSHSVGNIGHMLAKILNTAQCLPDHKFKVA